MPVKVALLLYVGLLRRCPLGMDTWCGVCNWDQPVCPFVTEAVYSAP